MSTLVVLGVVILAIAGVLHLVLDQPDQPPTIRRRSGREPAGGGHVGRLLTPVVEPAEDLVAVPVMVVEVSTPDSRRVRSAVTLMVLVAALGVAVALVVAAAVIGAATLVTTTTA